MPQHDGRTHLSTLIENLHARTGARTAGAGLGTTRIDNRAPPCDTILNSAVIRYVHVTPLPAIADLERLTYALPDELSTDVRAGMRVLVPLGPRRITALVTQMADAAPDDVTCRNVLAVLDDAPIVTEGLLHLLEWMAEYYLAGLGDTLSLAVGRTLTSTSRRVVALRNRSAAHGEAEEQLVAALEKIGKAADPTRLASMLGRRTIDRLLFSMAERGVIAIEDLLPRPKTTTRFETVVSVERMPDDAAIAALFARAPKRRAIFEHLSALPHRRATLADLTQVFPSAGDSLAALAEAGIVRLTRSERYRTPGGLTEDSPPPTLTQAQSRAVAAIECEFGGFATFLLQGVTASGKTEIYLRSIETALAAGSGALVLVPEISLTHQVVARLRGRFGDLVAVLHSDLSAGERWDEWRRLARSEARIAVGARSAVLAPVPNLGLIVVDEEHDSAYKQDDGVRYNARDVAVMRARIESCPVVLGSATPSLESWRHAREGRYRHLHMPSRVTASAPPRMEAIDLRGRDLEAGGGLSEPLIDAMRANFEARGQTLLFLNRRGYARSLQCWSCGLTLECNSCSVALTLHQNDRTLRCHHCDARRAVPARCPGCGADALFSQGLGTQRLETTVRSLLPSARVARLDRDTTEQRGLLASTLGAWRRAEIDVLIGTQMIAKGHDVPGVTLVGVVQADLALAVPDFRGAERTFQLLTQVAGRAGRGSEQGRVLVQTYQPEHPAIALAIGNDFDGFAQTELAERAELGYPPITRMGMLRLEGADRGATERVAAQAARAMAEAGASDPAFVVRGPAPAVIEKVKDRYRYHVHARAPRSTMVRHALSRARLAVSAAARSAGVRVLIDVDPVDMF